MGSDELISIALPLLGALAGVLSAVFTTRYTVSKHRAEDRLIHLMIAALTAAAAGAASQRRTKRDVALRVPPEQISGLVAALERDPPDDTALSRARELINVFYGKLSEADRKQIAEGLNQRSERGRADYVAKLLMQTQSKRGRQLAGTRS